MKRIFIITISILLLSSCWMGGSGVGISTKQDLETVKKEVIEKMGADVAFVELRIITDNPQRCNFEGLFIENKDNQLFYLQMRGDVTKNKSNLDEKAKSYTSVKLNDLDIEKIIEFKNTAIETIKKATQEFISFQISSIEIAVKEDASLEYTIDISAQQKEKKPTLYGERHRIDSNFLVFKFRTDNSGKLECVKGMPE